MIVCPSWTSHAANHIQPVIFTCMGIFPDIPVLKKLVQTFVFSCAHLSTSFLFIGGRGMGRRLMCSTLQYMYSNARYHTRLSNTNHIFHWGWKDRVLLRDTLLHPFYSNVGTSDYKKRYVCNYHVHVHIYLTKHL